MMPAMRKLGSRFYEHRLLLLILLGGLLIHLAVTLPAILAGRTETAFCRPDSAGYLAPARALAAEGAYRTGPGGPPHLERVPGLPVFLAVVFKLFGPGNLAAAALLLGFAAVFTCLPVYLAGRELYGRRAGLLAALLFSLNPTVIANRPLILTDSLFTLFIATALWLFLRYCRRRERRDFLLCALLAGAAALIRPINAPWIFPALFILAILPRLNWKNKVVTGAAALALFFAPQLPWMIRNARLGAGYCLDTNTGAMYHQNGAMLLARVNRSSFEEEKQKILAELEAEFRDTERYPDAKSQTDYRLKRFRALILAHPVVWFGQHLRPQVLLPDLPTFCEVLGISRSDRGTLDVLQRHGLFAAVRHYFAGIYWIIPLAAPLLAVALLTLLAAVLTLLRQLRHPKRNYVLLFTFLAFAEYYFFLPGPITVPRYQLPALPYLCLLAAAALLTVTRLFLKRRREGKTFVNKGSFPLALSLFQRLSSTRPG